MPLTNQLPTLMNGNQGLIGYSPPQTGLMTAGMQPMVHPLSPMGPWSQLAYQMAGSPRQGGGYAGVPVPPAPAGSGGSSGGSGTGSSILTGLLGALVQNPSIIKNLGSSISGLLGGGSSAGSIGSVMAGGSPTLAPVSAPAVSELPSVTSAVDAGAASGASGSSAAPAGLLGAGAAAGSAGSTLGAGAPGVFASGNAAAGSAGASSATTGLAAAAIPAAFAALGIYGLTKGLGSQAENNAGNKLFSSWLQDSGSTSKVVNAPTPSQAASVAQGGFASAGSGYHPQSVIYDKNGQAMSQAQVELAMNQYAAQTGMSKGNFNLTDAQLQQIISSGGYGSQVYGTNFTYDSNGKVKPVTKPAIGG